MRILVVSQYFWPENFRINDLAAALKERGHEVTVLTGMPNYPSGKMFEGYSWWRRRHDSLQGISIYRVPLFLRRESKGWQLVLNYFSFMISASVVGPVLLRKANVDVVFVGGYSPFLVGFPAALLARMNKAPMFYWLQDLWPENLSATGAVKNEKVLIAVARMVKRMYGWCDKILVQSTGFVAPAIEVGARKEQISYLPNWAESLYQPVSLPADAPERREIPADGFVAMFAGNLGAAQSLDTILEAAEILRDEAVYWVFLGDGRRRQWMQEQVKARGLSRVHILGNRPVGTMPAYFSLADAMLVTLREDPVMTTTIPGKVQSYLACARPVIGALNGEGARVIEESGAGFCAASGDAGGLAQAVRRMSEASEEERKQMGDAALAYYRQNFDRERLITRLEGWMQEAVGAKR